MGDLIHRHEYGACCEHADAINARLDYLEFLVTPPPPPEEESVVVEPTAETTDSDTDSGTDTDEPAVDIDIDIDVHADADAEDESGSESESDHEDEDEDTADVDESSEVVIEGETGLPELTEDEKERDRGHPLPMRR